jgi:hypothetical protein
MDDASVQRELTPDPSHLENSTQREDVNTRPEVVARMTDQRPSNQSERLDDQKYSIVADYLDRIISRLQSRATLMYWTIVGTLIAGVLLIIFAGSFAAFDTELMWWRLDNERHRIYSDITTPPKNDELKAWNDQAITHYWENYDRLLHVSLAGYDQRNVFNWVPIALKVSVAGILIFLVQILIQLYRYNSLLIVFYSARRYAIIMSGGDLSATERWQAIFAPTNLDFGSNPRHPFQYFSYLLHREGSSATPPVAPAPTTPPPAATAAGSSKAGELISGEVVELQKADAGAGGAHDRIQTVRDGLVEHRG